MAETGTKWANLLTPELSEAFFVGFTAGGRRSSQISDVFGMRSSDRSFEQHRGVGAFGSDGWNFKTSGRVQYGNRDLGYQTTFTHIEYAKGHQVERNLVDDNLTDISFDDARLLGDSAFRFREKAGADVFNNAFTDSGTTDAGFDIAGFDSVGLLSAAHPRSARDAANTQSNEGTLALTNANVSTTRQLHMALTDDRGDILDVQPDEILVPPELEDAAIEALGSAIAPLTPASANNAQNPQTGRFQIRTWHYLTDANAWFLIDSARRAQDLLWYERIPVEYAAEEDFDTLIGKFRAYMRFSRNWRDFRFIYGQNPS